MVVNTVKYPAWPVGRAKKCQRCIPHANIHKLLYSANLKVVAIKIGPILTRAGSVSVFGVGIGIRHFRQYFFMSVRIRYFEIP